MWRAVALCTALIISSPAWAGGYAAVTEDGKAAVATVQPRATEAALAVLNDGGNAVDAAVAAALTLGVVDGHNSGIGGGSFILVRWADGEIETIDGREVAPAKAHRDMYLRDGKLIPHLSRTGALAIGIPGAVAAYDYMLRKGGKKTLSDLLLPAAELAERGFAIDGVFAHRLERHAEELKRFPGSAEIFLDPDGNPWPRGHQLVQKDLAATYRKLAKDGPKYFYEGEFARRVDRWMKNHGGVVTAQDFADYTLEHPEPVLSRYGSFQVVGFPPPSSGGVHVAQILNILEHFDLSGMSTAQRYHVIAEAMKLAFADRAHWLGDPAFAKVPKGLVSREYAAQLAEKISLERVRDVTSHGAPPKADEELFGRHTTHIATADKDGNWVAITGTVNTNFGSKVVVPGTGVILNNQMDDFSAQPGEPNIYGLVGAEANSIEPGKRPLSSMSPTLVLNAKGEPTLTLGAAGGPTIITQVALTLILTLELEVPLEEALKAPRLHHQWRPDALFVEQTLPDSVRAVLEDKGHELRRLGDFGSTQAIGLGQRGEFISVAEPRLEARNRVHE
jgi:gamma-glutamyltranspeptidase / glutathione hydrolase